MTAERASNRRAARKAATRSAIQEHALRLFLAQGYQATTVEQIAAAAGVSHMTFFRYFPTKESVVDTDDHDDLLSELLRSRPRDEDAIAAVHRSLQQALATILPAGRDALLERTRLIMETPALRARQADNQRATAQVVARALAARDGRSEPGFALQVLASAAVATLVTALTAWYERGGEPDLRAVVDDAFTTLRGARHPAHTDHTGASPPQ